MIEWSIDCLIDWCLLAWLLDLVIDWLIDGLIDSLIDWLMLACLIAWLLDWLIDSLMHWLIACFKAQARIQPCLRKDLPKGCVVLLFLHSSLYCFVVSSFVALLFFRSVVRVVVVFLIDFVGWWAAGYTHTDTNNIRAQHPEGFNTRKGSTHLRVQHP